MNIFQKAIKEAKDLDTAINSYKTPEFRNPIPPPNPNPNYIPPAFNKPTPPPPPKTGSKVKAKKATCTYETPCGWCTKWDKKCDNKIGCGDENKLKRGIGIKMRPLDEAFNPCSECAHEDLDLPICDSCNISNGFKYFEGWENTK